MLSLIRRQNRSHSDFETKGLAVTNKGRMPYQKNLKNNGYRMMNNEVDGTGVQSEHR